MNCNCQHPEGVTVCPIHDITPPSQRHETPLEERVEKLERLVDALQAHLFGANTRLNV